MKKYPKLEQKGEDVIFVWGGGAWKQGGVVPWVRPWLSGGFALGFGSFVVQISG